jgi:asparagine synthase (glutamine-hydrolysing)
MGKVQAHRGPDDCGAYLSANVGFSFQRLSIIDLAGGHQPMFSPCENAVIVFNGEIYNFPELREELTGLGVTFRTNSDTEVILAGYEVWEESIVDKLRGMFAFVLYDIRKNALFMARDHTGIKPLYFSSDSDCFVFASEIKAILQFPGITASVRTDVLPKHMCFLWVPAPETLFENIYILEPGSVMTVSRQGVRKRRFWHPELIGQDACVTERQWIEKIDCALRRIVKEQMISDVPLGAFLSGGVDSSTIIAYMNRTADVPITTYTTGFGQEDLSQDVTQSDLDYARLAATQLHIDYNELILAADVVNLLPRLVWHMDEPVADPAAVTTYLICKAAKEKCTVMLSGVGGDEIFGGYPRYLAELIAEKYQHIPRVLRQCLIEWWMNKVPIGSSVFRRNARKFLKSVDLPFTERYFGYLTYYSQSELRKLLRMDFDWSNIFAGHRQILHDNERADNLQSMMNLDLQTFLPNLNLMYTDKMSSAVAVEVRVPFLDHLLKKTAEQYLPSQVVWRRKVGFGAPVGAWLKGQAREMMLDLLSEETIRRRGYFNYSYVSSLINGHFQGREYNANQLWQLMVFELWHREFMD